MDNSVDIPIVVLKPLAGNSPAKLNAVQQFLLPHLSLLETMLWCLWWTILGYLVLRYLVAPLIKRGKQEKTISPLAGPMPTRRLGAASEL
jgi:hypothetical protein